MKLRSRASATAPSAARRRQARRCVPVRPSTRGRPAAAQRGGRASMCTAAPAPCDKAARAGKRKRGSTGARRPRRSRRCAESGRARRCEGGRRAALVSTAGGRTTAATRSEHFQLLPARRACSAGKGWSRLARRGVPCAHSAPLEHTKRRREASRCEEVVFAALRHSAASCSRAAARSREAVSVSVRDPADGELMVRSVGYPRASRAGRNHGVCGVIPDEDLQPPPTTAAKTR